MERNVRNLVAKINPRKLTNNTQKVLLTLLTSKREWVSRTSIRVPSVGSRLRDLRKPQFGGFVVECAVRSKPQANGRQTFYRLHPSTVTTNRISKVFEGVIDTSK